MESGRLGRIADFLGLLAMKPYFDNGNCQLYHGDALPDLRQLANGRSRLKDKRIAGYVINGDVREYGFGCELAGGVIAAQYSEAATRPTAQPVCRSASGMPFGLSE